ncbi:MAG: DUF423 domain-containing protein [Cardiobacteriaceae bacterium]|nr:DUF423 domain-containing protein [Cardiobacteriaceae bacterium]
MLEKERIWLLLWALSGFLWVALGAATGHEPLPAVAAVYFEKAQRYHIIHTLAAMVLLALPVCGKRWILSLWLAGVLCFSGSLYAMVLTGLPLRYVVPVGGVAFLGGWLGLAVVALKR